MTDLAPPVTAPTGRDAPAPARARPRRRLVVWVVVALVAAALAAVVTAGRTPNEVPLDPGNPGPDGLQALHEVLVDQGVQVRVVRGLPALVQEQAGPGTTVLVVGTALLDAESGARVLRHTREADRVLVLDPGVDTDDVLGLPVRTRDRSSTQALVPDCADPTWREGDTVRGTDTLVEVTDRDVGATVCLPPGAGFGAGGAVAGHAVTFPATAERARTSLLGIAPALTNEHVTEAANAATGLRLLGASPRLVWYVPSPADVGAGTPRSLVDVLPPATVPGTMLVLAAVATLALWRGRRLGRVVPEPLPVVVRSSETTTSRARLYRAAGDRRRALAALQVAAVRRLTTRLGLPPRTPLGEVAARVGEVTGRPVDEVRRLLSDPAADDDETLVRTARALRDLEEGTLRT